MTNMVGTLVACAMIIAATSLYVWCLNGDLIDRYVATGRMRRIDAAIISGLLYVPAAFLCYVAFVN